MCGGHTTSVRERVRGQRGRAVPTRTLFCFWICLSDVPCGKEQCIRCTRLCRLCTGTVCVWEHEQWQVERWTVLRGVLRRQIRCDGRDIRDQPCRRVPRVSEGILPNEYRTTRLHGMCAWALLGCRGKCHEPVRSVSNRQVLGRFPHSVAHGDMHILCTWQASRSDGSNRVQTLSIRQSNECTR